MAHVSNITFTVRTLVVGEKREKREREGGGEEGERQSCHTFRTLPKINSSINHSRNDALRWSHKYSPQGNPGPQSQSPSLHSRKPVLAPGGSGAGSAGSAGL